MDATPTYHQLNRERFAARKKEWARANPDRVAAANRRWREKNKESLRAKQAEYQKKGYYHSKLIQRFNVMRGEILTGNDSTELLAEFKRLIDEMHQRELLDDDDYESVTTLI